MRIVRDAVADSAELLELLHALAFADAKATGPAAWSDWKAGLIADLVRRSRAAMVDGRHPTVTPLDDERRELAQAGELAVLVRAGEVIIAAPDAPGRCTAAPASWPCTPWTCARRPSGPTPGWRSTGSSSRRDSAACPTRCSSAADLARALKGELGLDAKLAEKERAYSRRGPDAAATGADHPLVRRIRRGDRRRVPRRGRDRPAAPDHRRAGAGRPGRPLGPGVVGRRRRRRRVLRHRRRREADRTGAAPCAGGQTPRRPRLSARRPSRSCPPFRAV